MGIRSLAAVALALALTAASAGPLSAQTHIPSTTTIKTAKGDFQVPGRAFLDGRNLEAEPRFTIMTVQIWQSTERRQAVCSADHGTQVDVLDVRRSPEEQRYYFRIRAPKCEGWVDDASLSVTRQAPVGAQRREPGKALRLTVYPSRF
jgi:hypothetical protein